MYFTFWTMLLIAMAWAVPLDLPIHLTSRQIGDLQCNVARLKTVGALAKAQKAVKTLAMTSNGTDATNIATASSSLASASDGIKTIAGAILTGKDAPAAARQQVGDGLQNALSALQNVTGEDTSAAQQDINDALSAGADVVKDCN